MSAITITVASSSGDVAIRRLMVVLVSANCKGVHLHGVSHSHVVPDSQ